MIHDTIKGWREAKGLSQLEVSERIGMKEHEYALKENGKKKFMVRDVIVICRVLEVDLEHTTI